MKRTQIKNLKLNEEVLLGGFAHAIRVQSNVIFIELRDLTGNTQLVVEKGNSEAFKLAKSLVLESVISISGVVKENGGKLEVLVSNLEILSKPVEKLPIQVNEKEGEEPELNAKLVHKHIELRKPKVQLIYKLWTELEYSFQSFLKERGFIQIHSPKFMGAPSESGAEVFEVNYFGGKAYLAQSPQFYKQMALISGFEKVFEIGPVFRAEKSNTVRHATEFTGYDVEMAFIKNYEEVMAFEEQLLVHIFTKLKKEFGKEIKEVYGAEIIIPKAPFPKIPLSMVKEILRAREIESEKENDISPLEEIEIGKYILEEYGHEFVFITEYPIEKRPFYHMRHENANGQGKQSIASNENKTTYSFDLLFKGIEITTGAQREHRYEVLLQQAIEREDELREY